MSIIKSASKLSQRQINTIRLLMSPVKYFIQFIDLLYPKDDRIIICGSNTGQYASGSSHALYNYLKNNYPHYEPFFYLPFKKEMSTKERIKYMIHYLPLFLKARYLISTHPANDFFPFSGSRRKILVNVWHGIPLKSLFFADSGESKSNLKEIEKITKKSSIFVVSSSVEAAFIARCFLIESKKIQCTGHPRNDVLLQNKANDLYKFVDLPQHEKIILYCPTYRRKSETKFFPFDDFEMENLKKFLEDNQMVILIRGHSASSIDPKEAEIFSDRIIDFSFDVCADIYSILNNVDLLITDYSSIYLDYLLLNKPCAFIPYDLEEYTANRGLLVDDYDFWTPGSKIDTYSNFLNVLRQVKEGHDPYQNHRQNVCRQFHFCHKGSACENVIKLMFNNLKKPKK